MAALGNVALAVAAGLVGAGATAALAVFGVLPTAGVVATPERAAMEKLVHDYVVQNPEILLEAQKALQTRQAAREAAEAREKLASKPETLENSKLQAVLGNPDGDVTLVEFFDYNCGYCRRALGDLNALIEKDPKLRVVLKEFPILGRGSAEAAQVSAAVNLIAPDKYKTFHDALLSAQGQADLASATRAATAAGVDAAALEEALKRPEVRATIEEAYALASQFGVESTPVFIVGDAILPGAVGEQAIKSRIDALRKCGKTACS
ncbi:DsbA family protein [Methylopila musalis]|uniref:DsbA family protein n=1 Tax=Methylopila musalis TaxID=1134781 RepID=A0ABW3Z5C8_9HYPH